MELRLSNLEKKLLGFAEPDLAWGALVASGVRNQGELSDYLAKIDTLCQYAQADSHACDDLQKARVLFDRLWTKKPNRYQTQGNFRLTAVIDAQLSFSEEKVGDRKSVV